VRAVESAAASAVAVEDEDGLISYVLPPGWKELVDKKTGRTYYVNRCGLFPGNSSIHSTFFLL
jgi:hypothetical protein